MKTNQQTSLARWSNGTVSRIPDPPIFPGSLRAVSTRKTYPSGFLGSKSQIPHPVGLPTDTNRFLGRDGEDIGLLLFLQPQTQTAVTAIHRVPGYPLHGQAGLESMLQHLPCQLRFGGKACFLGNPGFPATGRIFRPAFGQVQTAIDQRGTFWGDITEKNTDLAVLNPSGRSAVLTLHACGLIPFFEKTGFIHD